MSCHHETGGKDWAEIQSGILKLHPYCGRCGTFKNISSDKGKRISYFVCCLSNLRRSLRNMGYKVSEAQIRLITKELSEMPEFQDTWWITFSKQKEIFVSVVKKYIKVSEELIKASLD